MTAIRDTAIWTILQQQDYDVTLADRKTIALPPVETNYNLGDSDDSAGPYTVRIQYVR